jgi:hypothetical protein
MAQGEEANFWSDCRCQVKPPRRPCLRAAFILFGKAFQSPNTPIRADDFGRLGPVFNPFPARP